jgi:hypothetical protein
MIKQIKPARRQGQPAPHTLKQNDTQLFFQSIHLPPKGWLRHPERPRRRAQRTLLSRHQKGPRAIPVKVHSFPIHAKMHIKSTDLVNFYYKKA